MGIPTRRHNLIPLYKLLYRKSNILLTTYRPVCIFASHIPTGMSGGSPAILRISTETVPVAPSRNTTGASHDIRQLWKKTAVNVKRAGLRHYACDRPDVYEPRRNHRNQQPSHRDRRLTCSPNN